MSGNADSMNEHIEEIRKCQACAVEAKRKPLPKTAIPRASNFNQILTMDLKYNTKYSNKSSYPFQQTFNGAF